MDESEIEVIEGLEAVRMRPEVYVGPIDAPDLPARLLVEALCHAFDEAIDGACSRVSIKVRGRTATIAYDAGLPLCTQSGMPAAHTFLATLYACRARKKHVTVGQELCRAGLAVVNALSATFVASIVSNGSRCTLFYQSGSLVRAPQFFESSAQDGTEFAIELEHTILPQASAFETAMVEAEVEKALDQLPVQLSVVVREAK